MLLDALLKRLIRDGSIAIRYADGTTRSYGDPAAEPAATLEVKAGANDPRILYDPSLAFAEAYMAGDFVLAEGDLVAFLSVVLDNIERRGFSGAAGLTQRLRRWLRPLAQFNRITRARANVAHHYDLSGALYDLFLDADRQYSCAYWPEPEMTLDEAQLAKKHHIAGKLLLEPGHRVLDIGCGWGGLALDLAGRHGAEVTGITLSTEQLALARQRAEKAGLAEQVQFALTDYRQVQGRFDRIVSVGMFEHVGVTYYDTYFATIRDHLTDDGVALVHTIGRSGEPGPTNSFIAKYIFPGGYTPSLSEIMTAVERSGLVVCDIEVWRLHYAATLKEWRRRFLANWTKAEALYDTRFCRMWDLYLASCEASFRCGGQVVFQLQLARRNDAVPITRNYLHGQPVEAVAVDRRTGRRSA